MDLTYNDLRRIARAIGVKTTVGGRTKTKSTLLAEIERAKPSRLRFDPAFASEYRVADLLVFAQEAGIPKRANGKAKTKAELIADLTSAGPAKNARKDTLCSTLCGGDARLVQELDATKAQLQLVESELLKVYDQYQKVSMSNRRMNKRMNILNIKSTNLE